MSERAKYLAAKSAFEELNGAKYIGLGTGSTAKYFVDLLGKAVANGFECKTVATSNKTEKQARELNIPLIDLDEVDELDLVVDGADEIDNNLNLIKGGGGALLREKIVASKSKKIIIIADKSKLVTTLGKFPLPIEINKFAHKTTMRAIEKIMPKFGETNRLELRKNSKGENFITDGGHFIIDAFFGRISDARKLSCALLEIPGIVQHGLFLNMCDLALVADNEDVYRYEK